MGNLTDEFKKFGKLKIHLAMKVTLMPSKDNDDKRLMYSKSENDDKRLMYSKSENVQI